MALAFSHFFVNPAFPFRPPILVQWVEARFPSWSSWSLGRRCGKSCSEHSHAFEQHELGDGGSVPVAALAVCGLNDYRPHGSCIPFGDAIETNRLVR